MRCDKSEWLFGCGWIKVVAPLLIGLLVALLSYLYTGWPGFWLIFPWIGGCITLADYLSGQKPQINRSDSRRVVIVMIAPLFLVFLGYFQHENLQLEETVFYLSAGVFSRVLIHYAVAKIFGPLLWGRGFCGWACWTAAVLEWLPIGENRKLPSRLGLLRIPVFILSIVAPLGFIWSGYDYMNEHIVEKLGKEGQFAWFLIGNAIYYIVAVAMAFYFKKKRAFCKIACPVALVMKLPTKFAIIKKGPSGVKCIECGLCNKSCPMDVDVMAFIRQGSKIKSTECILCHACSSVCPVKAIRG